MAMRVLIVDDCEDIRKRLCQMMLEVAGVDQVLTAGDGEEAQQVLSSAHPDVMLLDLALPKASGFEVLEFAEKAEVSVYTIVLTNYWYAPFRKKAFKLGAKCFFDKSLDFELVQSVVRQHIEKSASKLDIAAEVLANLPTPPSRQMGYET